jgi:Flp pilus assembly protein TadB
MSPLLIVAVVAGVLLVAGTCVVVWLGARPAEAGLERRLGAVAALFGGEGAVADGGDAQASVFRRRRSKSWVSERIDRRFCMLEGRRAFRKAVALGFLVAVAAAVAAFLLRFGTLVPILVPAAWAAGSWSLLVLWDSGRRKKFVKQFPDIVDHVVRLTRAGLPAVESISVVSEEAPEPVGSLLKQISDDLSSGLDPEVVLRGMAARLRIPEFTLFSAALCLQRTTGGGISAALGNLSATLRARLELEMKAEASTAQTRITLFVLSGVPVLVLGAQSFTNPQAVDILFESPTLLRWGVGLVVVGLLVARGIAARFGR